MIVAVVLTPMFGLMLLILLYPSLVRLALLVVLLLLLTVANGGEAIQSYLHPKGCKLREGQKRSGYK